MPAHIVESIFLLTCIILVAVPLFVHVQYLLDECSKEKKIEPLDTDWSDMVAGYHVSRVVMHYPAPIFPESTSSLSINMEAVSARKIYSAPILQAHGDVFNVEGCHIQEKEEMERQQQHIHGEMATPFHLEHSSSFIVTNSNLPIIDISNFNYDAYRHKVIEAILRKKYDDEQPLGNVIMNSIHLNTTNSTADIALRDRYSHSFFNFIEGYDCAIKGLSKQEMEYLHPLDHFLIKGTRQLKTIERSTETAPSLTHKCLHYEDPKDQYIAFPTTTTTCQKCHNVDSAKHCSVIGKSSSQMQSVKTPKSVYHTNINVARRLTGNGKRYVGSKVSKIKLANKDVSDSCTMQPLKNILFLNDNWTAERCLLKVDSNP